MKNKPFPVEVNSGNSLEQACLEGLTKKGKRFAKEKIKKFADVGFAVPYGIIRKEAQKL